MFTLQPEITTSVVDDPSAARSHAVVDALLRFGLAQDRRYAPGSRELFESAFTEDAVLDFRPAATTCGIDVPLMRGREMITGIIMNPGARLDTTHVVTNPRVRIDGDTATMTALVEAQHLPTGDHSRHALLKNLYAVSARRAGNLWRMNDVYIECTWYTGDPTVITG
ncbi:hypothetical protein GCM10027059_32670 [Myceligenerans halotolerans]